jgi:hypothetical protein
MRSTCFQPQSRPKISLRTFVLAKQKGGEERESDLKQSLRSLEEQAHPRGLGQTALLRKECAKLMRKVCAQLSTSKASKHLYQ